MASSYFLLCTSYLLPRIGRKYGVHGKVLGYIVLEKQGDGSPFSAQQEIVVAAVGQQTGLGILRAVDRQDEEARQRLERNRMQWGNG